MLHSKQNTWKIPISNLHGSEHLSGQTSDPAVKQHLASRLMTKCFRIRSTIITALVRDTLVLCRVAWVKDFRKAKEKLQVDIRIRGFICRGSRDENEWVAENVWCFLIKWKQKSRVKISAIIALVVCNVAYCKIENYVLIRLAVVAFKVIGSEQE